MKKSDFAAVTNTIEREKAPPAMAAPDPGPARSDDTPSYPKHRQGKKAVISYHSKAMAKALKQIALDEDKTLQDITEEAFKLVLKQYGVELREQE